MNKLYFSSVKDAVEWQKKNNITEFDFEAPKHDLVGIYLIVKEPCFCCEICHCVTPRKYEGGEPNVCANCVPIIDASADEQNDR